MNIAQSRSPVEIEIYVEGPRRGDRLGSLALEREVVEHILRIGRCRTGLACLGSSEVYIAETDRCLTREGSMWGISG